MEHPQVFWKRERVVRVTSVGQAASIPSLGRLSVSHVTQSHCKGEGWDTLCALINTGGQVHRDPLKAGALQIGTTHAALRGKRRQPRDLKITDVRTSTALSTRHSRGSDRQNLCLQEVHVLAVSFVGGVKMSSRFPRIKQKWAAEFNSTNFATVSILLIFFGRGKELKAFAEVCFFTFSVYLISFNYRMLRTY